MMRSTLAWKGDGCGKKDYGQVIMENLVEDEKPRVATQTKGSKV
jgi:hypothetical protein